MVVDFLTLVILTFAAYRITRFFLFDSLMGMSMGAGGDDPASDFAIKVDSWAYNPDTGLDRSFLRGKIGDLLTCPWCLGFHIGWILLALWTWTLPWMVPSPQAWVITAFAIAGGQGFIQSRMNA